MVIKKRGVGIIAVVVKLTPMTERDMDYDAWRNVSWGLDRLHGDGPDCGRIVTNLHLLI